MADSADGGHDSSGDNKDKLSLEELSKEDLEKQVKKYLNFLQKTERKCDELNNKCISLEKERDAANEVIAKYRNESNTEYIEELRYEIKELNKKVAQLTEGKGSTSDEFDVIKAAKDTDLRDQFSAKCTLEAHRKEQLSGMCAVEADLVEQLNAKNAIEKDLVEQLNVKGVLEEKLREELNSESALIAELYEQIRLAESCAKRMSSARFGKHHMKY